MDKIRPIDWRLLVKVFESQGFEVKRKKGSHLSMVKQGSPRPIVIPMHKEVTIGVIQANLKTAGISRELYFDVLKKAKC